MRTEHGGTMGSGESGPNREAQELQLGVFQTQLKDFLENTGLYQSRPLDLPKYPGLFRIEVARLYCPIEKDKQPYRETPYIGTPSGSGAGHAGTSEFKSSVRSIYVVCQGCQKASYQFWLYINV